MIRESRMARKLRLTSVSLFCAVLSLCGSLVNAQELTVMSSGGFAAPYKLLAPKFEKQTGIHIDSVWGPSMGVTPGAIPVRLARGEPADVVIMVRSELDVLAKEALVIEGSQMNLVRSRIGMAVRAGASVPDISTVAALRRTLLRAKSVAYSDSASGVYVANGLYRKLGIEKELAIKSRKIPATPVGEVVARGKAQVGFQQMSELKPVQGITIVGPIPDEVQKVTIFAAGIVAKSTRPAQARALILFLASSASCPVIKASALEPIACPVSSGQK